MPELVTYQSLAGKDGESGTRIRWENPRQYGFSISCEAVASEGSICVYVGNAKVFRWLRVWAGRSGVNENDANAYLGNPEDE